MNSNSLQVFEQRVVLGKDFRIYGSIENPMFLAKDVAEWIEHSNPRMMLQSIDECEKVVNSKNMPTQRSMEMGIFEAGENIVTSPKGSTLITKTTRVTGKGQIYFINLFSQQNVAV